MSRGQPANLPTSQPALPTCPTTHQLPFDIAPRRSSCLNETSKLRKKTDGSSPVVKSTTRYVLLANFCALAVPSQARSEFKFDFLSISLQTPALQPRHLRFTHLVLTAQVLFIATASSASSAGVCKVVCAHVLSPPSINNQALVSTQLLIPLLTGLLSSVLAFFFYSPSEIILYCLYSHLYLYSNPSHETFSRVCAVGVSVEICSKSPFNPSWTSGLYIIVWWMSLGKSARMKTMQATEHTAKSMIDVRWTKKSP